MPEISPVADNARGPLCRSQHLLRDFSALDNHPDPARGKLFLRVPEPFEHEGVVPQVCLGVGLRQTEKHDNRQIQGVCRLDRILEGMVVFTALGLLHPVDHEAAGYVFPVVQFPDALGIYGKTHVCPLPWEVSVPLSKPACPAAMSEPSALHAAGHISGCLLRKRMVCSLLYKIIIS